jgi:hypothetical protein
MKLLLLALLISSTAFAKTETVELEGKKKVTVTYPGSWETAKDLYGIPLTVLGPFEDDSRPVVTILPTSVKSEMKSEKEFQKLFEDFKSSKEKWVATHQGQLLKYEPATKVELRKDLTGHYIGAEFVINKIHFIERSYYLYCKDEVYNLKYSLRKEHLKYIKDLQKIIGDFKCE